MSRILRFLMCLFCIVFIGDAVFAAGYECPTYRKYTTCNEGYYLAYSYSGTSGSNLRHDPTPRPGNACRPCSDYDAYKKVAKGSHTCAGGTAGPVLNTVTITYNLNGGSGTTPDSESCKKEETCTLNDGATTSFYRAGYVFKGWALTRTATSGFTSHTFTGSDTVYAVWEKCGLGEYKPGSGTQAAAACSQCPELTPGFDYWRVDGLLPSSVTTCFQAVIDPGDVDSQCTSTDTSIPAIVQIAASDDAWGTMTAAAVLAAKPGAYLNFQGSQVIPEGTDLDDICTECGVGTYSEGGDVTSCSACPEDYRDIAATSQANCEGTFEKTGSQQTPDMQTGCASRTLGTCSPGTCEYTKKYSGTIVNDCTPTDCTMSQTCTSAEKNYYLVGSKAASCEEFSSRYPYSDGGNITYPYCYRIDTNTGSQENGPVPDGCRSVDSWYDCEPGTCEYKNYHSATDETCTPANCKKDPETVVADYNHYVSGTSCPSCPTRYPYSDGGTGGQTVCYKKCSTDCTRQTCPSSAYSCTHGSSSNDGIWYYGDSSCSAPSLPCTLTVNSCKSGYYKYGNGCEPCSDLGDGSYTMSANDNSSGSGACYKSCTRACTRPTCPDNATCSYGSSSTSGTQYYNGSCSAASSTCTMTVTCKPGYYKNSSGTCNDCGGNEYYCPGDNNRYSVDPGHYSTGGRSTTRTGQEECTGAKYCTGGVQKSCPLATYGWTRNGGTGWTSYTQCNQTLEATLASSYCSAGTLKQNATSATAWGETTVSEALSAKAGAYVNGTTCSQCTANDYCTGGTADRKDCPTGYPNSAAGSDAITDCYSNTKSRPWTGSQVNGTTPTNCYSATWGSCRAEDMAACSYVAYSNSAGTADGTVKSGCTSNSANCTRQVASVTAKSGYYDAGTTCSECPNGYPNSANGNEGGDTKCYASVSDGHYIGTRYSATQSECEGGTYKAAHTVYYGSTSSCAVCGTNQYSDDGAASCTACKTSTGYGNSGTTAASHDGVASCKVTCDAGEYVPTAGGGCVAVGSGYYKTGTMTVAQNATNTTRSACSSLSGVSVSGGTYSSVSPYNASTTCRYKAPNKTITGCAAVTTATVAYSGSAWPTTTYTVSADPGYYISGSGTASATCVGCQAGYACTGGTAARDACDGQTQYQDAAKQSSCKTVSSGWYKVDNTEQAQCTGATYCTGGEKNNCPGSYTADTTAGKTSAQQCKISVAKGHHIATANSSTPADCDPGDYRAAHTVNYGSTSSCSACPSGYTSAAGTAGANTECYISVSGGHYIGTQYSATQSECAAGTYKAAHTVYYGSKSSCSACSGRTKYSAAGASSCKTVSSGYYTTGCNTSGNNCTGQSQCTGATYCAGGVKNNCPSGYTANTTAGKTAASSCQISCSGGTYVATAEAACTAVGDGYYRAAHSVSYGSTSTRNTCPSGYPNSDAGAAAITSCYSNSKSRPWSGGQISCETPAGCSDSTCNICTLPACSYVAYSNSTGSADGAIKSGCAKNNEDCQQTVKSVTAKAGRYVSGITCPACAVGTFQGSNDSTATSCSVCPGNTYAASTGMSSCSACPSGYTISGTAASNHDAKSDCSITCAAGTRVVTADAACTTPTGSWYTASHSVAAGSTTPAATVKACLTNYSTPNTTTRTDHDASTDCKISCAAGTRITTKNATSCTTPAGNWYVGAHSVAQGSISSYSNCLTNYTISGTAAANHDTASDCKISCGGGSYIATANNTTCSDVGAGYWAAASTVSQGSAGVRNACDDGLTTIGSGAGADEAGDCGRVLNVNGEKIYLRSKKKTTPSLNVSINGTTFYGNMGASGIGALKLKSNGTTYSVYDDSMQ